MKLIQFLLVFVFINVAQAEVKLNVTLQKTKNEILWMLNQDEMIRSELLAAAVDSASAGPSERWNGPVMAPLC